MKRIERTIYVECDLCWKNALKQEHVMYVVCIMCLLNENFECSVCGGDFMEPHDF